MASIHVSFDNYLMYDKMERFHPANGCKQDAFDRDLINAYDPQPTKFKTDDKRWNDICEKYADDVEMEKVAGIVTGNRQNIIAEMKKLKSEISKKGKEHELSIVQSELTRISGQQATYHSCMQSKFARRDTVSNPHAHNFVHAQYMRTFDPVLSAKMDIPSERNYSEMYDLNEKRLFLEYKLEQLSKCSEELWLFTFDENANLKIHINKKKTGYSDRDITTIANTIVDLFKTSAKSIHTHVPNMQNVEKYYVPESKINVHQKFKFISGFNTKTVLINALSYYASHVDVKYINAIIDALDIFTDDKKYSYELHKQILYTVDYTEYVLRYENNNTNGNRRDVEYFYSHLEDSLTKKANESKTVVATNSSNTPNGKQLFKAVQSTNTKSNLCFTDYVWECINEKYNSSKVANNPKLCIWKYLNQSNIVSWRIDVSVPIDAQYRSAEYVSLDAFVEYASKKKDLFAVRECNSTKSVIATQNAVPTVATKWNNTNQSIKDAISRPLPQSVIDLNKRKSMQHVTENVMSANYKTSSGSKKGSRFKPIVVHYDSEPSVQCDE